MDINSPWTDFVCSFPSDVCLFKEVFGASSVEKGQKHHIMECYLVWKPANRLPFRRQEKVEIMNVLTSTVLFHFHIASVLLSLTSILPPFWEKRLQMKMLEKIHMDINSPWTDFVCSFPSDVCLFKEVFGASSVEKGQKHHIMECYLVWKPANRLPFRIQEKVEMMNVLTSTVLSHFHIASVLLSLKSILAPFLGEEA